MKIEVSKTTKAHILNQHPHLTDKEIEDLFVYGKVKKNYYEAHRVNKYEFLRNCYYTLKIPSYLAYEYCIGAEIELMTNEDGVICTIHK